MKRCAKCGIAGDDADIDRHEPICIAVPCDRCQGKGVLYSSGCIHPRRIACSLCNGHGIKGGLLAILRAHNFAIAQNNVDKSTLLK